MFLEKTTHPYTLYPTTISNGTSPTNKPYPQVMATEFVMPVPHLTSASTHRAPYSHHHHQQQANISPASSTTVTPSPTSPRTVIPAHTRQLRPPKSPLYVPAVLRPTDPPRRAARQQGPPTPPHSHHNSFDDLQNAKPPSRRGTSDSGKQGLGAIEEAEWSTRGLGKVTGIPTREHWKPDTHSSHCDTPACPRTFTYFTRRHHCRRCGHIFCHEHSPFLIPLDQNAAFHPRGTHVRACESCFHEYGRWTMGRSRRASEDEGGDATQEQFTEPPTPTVSCPGSRGGFMGSVFGGKGQGGLGESLAQSVPRDWNWSTF